MSDGITQPAAGEGSASAPSTLPSLAAALGAASPPPVRARVSAAKAAELLELPDEAVTVALELLSQRAVTVFEPGTQTWSLSASSLRRLALHFAELVFLAARAAAQPCPRWALDPLFWPIMLELVTGLGSVEAP